MEPDEDQTLSLKAIGVFIGVAVLVLFLSPCGDPIRDLGNGRMNLGQSGGAAPAPEQPRWCSVAVSPARG